MSDIFELPEEPIKLEPNDVKIRPIGQYGCENCGEDYATHWVKIDLRHLGTETQVFEGCLTCCESFAEGIMESLGWRKDEEDIIRQ